MNVKTLPAPLLVLGALLFALPADAQQTARPLGTAEPAPYGFYEYLPFGYNASLAQKWPVVIFLHGLGEIGNGTTQLSDVTSHCLPNYVKAGTNYPFILISPQTPVWWEASTLDQMVEYLKSHYRIDENRIYMTGWSMGGGGTWRYARAHPEKLAAVMPLAPGRTSGDIYEGAKLVHIPTWILHAWGDSTVSADLSVRWANSIASVLTGLPSDVMENYPGTSTGPPGPGHTSDRTRTASFNAATNTWTWRDKLQQDTGSHPTLTLYNDTSHSICPRTYNDSTQAPLKWLLAQTRYSDAGAHNRAPSVAITAPASGAQFSQGESVSIKATVADTDGTVAKVEFYANAQKLGEDNLAPHELVWSNLPAGTHWLTVKATDNDGSTSAALVRITVQPGGGGKLALTPAMVVQESGAGDAKMLVDEQALAGEPRAGTGGQPIQAWISGTASDMPASAYIDLGHEVDLTDIYLFDTNGNDTSRGDEWVVSVGTPGNWTVVATESCDRYLTWKRHPVSVRTRYVRLTNQVAYVRMSEVVLYGGQAGGTTSVITPALAGAATGSAYFPLQFAFDAQPTVNANGQPEGGTGGSDAPAYRSRYGYIDFGPEWSKIRITSTWTRYRVSSVGDQVPYAALWWDDDTDTVNDTGLSETRINFNSARGLSTGATEPWVRDRDVSADPVVPRARYLLLHSSAEMTNRAKEYAILGWRESEAAHFAPSLDFQGGR